MITGPAAMLASGANMPNPTPESKAFTKGPKDAPPGKLARTPRSTFRPSMELWLYGGKKDDLFHSGALGGEVAQECFPAGPVPLCCRRAHGKTANARRGTGSCV